MSSPAAARSTSCESVVLASCIPIRAMPEC
jgi:hypothetical protein